MFSLLLVWLCFSRHLTLKDTTIPNIFFILTDDQGWNDVSYNGYSDVKTPNIDYLANNGIKLTNYYTQPTCCASRAALMTGRYPFRYHMQHRVLNDLIPFGLPLNEIILPQVLKVHKNYSTHIIGKWHLGYHTWKHTPNYRYFDTFFGYYTGKEDYYNHTRNGLYDLHNNTECIVMNNYSTYLYGNVTKDLLYQLKDSQNPWFIYLSFQAIHDPLQAPKNVINKYQFINNENRRIKVATIDVLDEVIGKLYKLLIELNVWNNTLLIFSSDNGGDPSKYQNNYPLKGGKHTLFEGGIKVPAFINGGYINGLKYDYKHLFHITDWFPTLTSFIGINVTNKSSLDGKDHSLSLLKISNITPRNEILHNLNSYNCNSSSINICGGIRYNNYKLIIGYTTKKSRYKRLTKWKNWNNNNNTNITFLLCNNYTKPNNYCPFSKKGCLYDISNDPCEFNDIKHSKPKIYKLLLNKLINYNKSETIPFELMVKKYQFEHIIIQIKISNNCKNNSLFWNPWFYTRKEFKKLSTKNYNTFKIDKNEIILKIGGILTIAIFLLILFLCNNKCKTI